MEEKIIEGIVTSHMRTKNEDGSFIHIFYVKEKNDSKIKYIFETKSNNEDVTIKKGDIVKIKSK